MKIINAYYGHTLLESVEFALKNFSGDRFDIGVGYAKNLTGDTFERFSTALDTWLKGSETRKFRLFIGDHRHKKDYPSTRQKKLQSVQKSLLPL